VEEPRLVELVSLAVVGTRRPIGFVCCCEQFLLRHRAPSYILPCPIMTSVNNVVATRKLVLKENFAKLSASAS